MAAPAVLLSEVDVLILEMLAESQDPIRQEKIINGIAGKPLSGKKEDGTPVTAPMPMHRLEMLYNSGMIENPVVPAAPNNNFEEVVKPMEWEITEYGREMLGKFQARRQQPKAEAPKPRGRPAKAKG